MKWFGQITENSKSNPNQITRFQKVSKSNPNQITRFWKVPKSNPNQIIWFGKVSKSNPNQIKWFDAWAKSNHFPIFQIRIAIWFDLNQNHQRFCPSLISVLVIVSCTLANVFFKSWPLQPLMIPTPFPPRIMVLIILFHDWGHRTPHSM